VKGSAAPTGEAKYNASELIGWLTDPSVTSARTIRSIPNETSSTTSKETCSPPSIVHRSIAAPSGTTDNEKFPLALDAESGKGAGWAVIAARSVGLGPGIADGSPWASLGDGLGLDVANGSPWASLADAVSVSRGEGVVVSEVLADQSLSSKAKILRAADTMLTTTVVADHHRRRHNCRVLSSPASGTS